MVEVGEEVWVAGEYVEDGTLIDRDTGHPGAVWNLLGIYPSRELAIKRCRTESHWVGPLPFGVDLPEETVEWPEVEWPILDNG